MSIRDNCGTITFPSANVASDIVKEHTFDPRDPPFIRIVTDDIDRDLRIECCLLPEGGIRLEVERAWPTVRARAKRAHLVYGHVLFTDTSYLRDACPVPLAHASPA